MNIDLLLLDLGVNIDAQRGADLPVRSPIDGIEMAALHGDSAADVANKIKLSHEAYLAWRSVPAPHRGELVRQFAQVLREHKDALGRLVCIESGKILEEGLGEVQEMIDVCEFATGLSRQLYGLTIASERAGHRMMETWHPLGVVGIISAFNFPVSVWSWNAALALVCGNAIVWKPSERTPLCALACQALLEKAIARTAIRAPEGLSQVVLGKHEAAETIADHPQVAILSATGSTPMGRALAGITARRLGRTLLELGGNNAMIVAPSANLDLALRAITFAAVGTAGQRCTSLRRLFVHSAVQRRLLDGLKGVYGHLVIGDPLDPRTLVGPLIDAAAYEAMQEALARAKNEGGSIFGGQRIDPLGFPAAYYVQPALVEMPGPTAIMRKETFAPILYAVSYDRFEDALAWHNDVPQGLASSIFTNDMQEAERFLSTEGSDCGIANVNIGPSGAEIGGAFGGEKETGGGRESGSDAWKNYMRRATNTINYSDDLPLAQGITFNLGS